MIFILFTGVILLSVMLFFIIKLPEQKKFHILYVLFGVLAGGAVGNMIDRIRLGYVVDFIYVSLINFPIFNVADIFVTCGALLFIIVFFVSKGEVLQWNSSQEKKMKEKD